VSDDVDHDANVFGALALMVADRMSDAFVGAGEADSSAAALSSLFHFLRRPTIDQLRRVVGLTPSGTVRLVDKLERERLLDRRPGPDKRSVTLALTPLGETFARGLSDQRIEFLRETLAVLSDEERAAFERATSKLLVGLMRPPGTVRWMCRLCDLARCGRPRGLCPVYNEALERYGPRQRP